MQFEIDFNIIERVTPLDAQFGLGTPKTVPDDLRDWVFGGDPSESTFALLDAAKVLNLADLLDSMDAPHTCLFSGDAAETYRDVAPWLVQLRADDKLTRQVFSEEGFATPMWPLSPGILLRSEASLDALAQHFRRFTRLPDHNGNRVFLRFWEPLTLADFLSGQTADAPSELAQALTEIDGSPIGFAGWWEDSGFWTARATAPTSGKRTALHITQADRALLTRRQRAAFHTKIRKEAQSRIDKQGLSYEQAEIDRAADLSAGFVFTDPRVESASVRDGTALLMVLLLLGPEAGQTVLDGPVMRNLDLTLGQRIEITGQSYIVGMKRVSKKDVL